MYKLGVYVSTRDGVRCAGPVIKVLNATESKVQLCCLIEEQAFGSTRGLSIEEFEFDHGCCEALSINSFKKLVSLTDLKHVQSLVPIEDKLLIGEEDWPI
jgi:hypothetical protein